MTEDLPDEYLIASLPPSIKPVVRRRLEKLEKIEAVIKERGVGWEDWSNAADALSGYWKVEDAEKAVLEERLEKCEAALRTIAHGYGMDHLKARDVPAAMQEAARAALEKESPAVKKAMERFRKRLAEINAARAAVEE